MRKGKRKNLIKRRKNRIEHTKSLGTVHSMKTSNFVSNIWHQQKKKRN